MRHVNFPQPLTVEAARQTYEPTTPAPDMAGFLRAKRLALIGAVLITGAACSNNEAEGGPTGCTADIEFNDGTAVVRVDDHTPAPEPDMDRYAVLELNFGIDALRGNNLNQFPSSEPGGGNIRAFTNDIQAVPRVNPDEPYVWAAIVDVPKDGLAPDLLRNPKEIKGATNYRICAAWEVDGSDLNEVDPSVLPNGDPGTPGHPEGQQGPESPSDNTFFESAGSAECRSTVIVETSGSDGRHIRFNTLPHDNSDINTFNMNTLLVMRAPDGSVSYLLSGGNSVRAHIDDIVAANPIAISVHAVDYLDGRRLSDIERPLDEAIEECLAGEFEVLSLEPLILEDTMEPSPDGKETTTENDPRQHGGEWEGTLEMSCDFPRATLHKDGAGNLTYNIKPANIVLDGKERYEVDEELRERTENTTVTSIVQVLDESGNIVTQYHETGRPVYGTGPHRDHNDAPTVAVPATVVDSNRMVRIFVVEGRIPNTDETFEEQLENGSLGLAPCGTEEGVFSPWPPNALPNPHPQPIYLEPLNR